MPLAKLIDLANAGINAGATRFNFADTTGSLTPEATRHYCQGLTLALPHVPRVCHFHNDFDLATINSITGVLNGFTIVTTTVNGLGERAGNAPMHSTVSALRYLYGLEIPNFKYDRLWHAKRVVEEITGIPVSVQEPVIGYNAFAHESGIHTHGAGISRRMYEPIPHRAVGGVPRIVYGKHSGSNSLFELLTRHADEIDHPIDQNFVLKVLGEVKRMREEMGYQTDPAQFIRDYYDRMSKDGFTEDDVVELAKAIARNVNTSPGSKHVMAENATREPNNSRSAESQS
jgi:isopropylmalate/homocitrate/citramalate synthase